MTVEKLELNPKKYRVEITMKTVTIIDKYVKKPSKDNILENFADCVYHRMFDEKFEITIKSVE